MPCPQDSLESQLQTALIDLRFAEQAQQLYLSQKTQFRAMAAEAEQIGAQMNYTNRSVMCAGQAEGAMKEAHYLRERIADLRARINAAPVVLTAEQCRAMDDTAGLAA